MHCKHSQHKLIFERGGRLRFYFFVLHHWLPCLREAQMARKQAHRMTHLHSHLCYLQHFSPVDCECMQHALSKWWRFFSLSALGSFICNTVVFTPIITLISWFNTCNMYSDSHMASLPHKLAKMHLWSRPLTTGLKIAATTLKKLKESKMHKCINIIPRGDNAEPPHKGLCDINIEPKQAKSMTEKCLLSIKVEF